MEFAMSEAVKGTILSKAKRLITEIQAKAICNKCKHHFDVEDYFAVCPKCGSFETTITQGKELKIKKLIIQ